jgi:hypothetical protein
VAQRQRESVGRVGRWQLPKPESVPHYEGYLLLFGPTVPDDGSLDPCRLQFHHLAAPPTEHGEQRATGLGEGERCFGETPEERRLHCCDVGREAAKEFLKLIRQGRERRGARERTPRHQTTELDNGHTAGIACDEPPARDPSAGIEAEDAGQLS